MLLQFLDVFSTPSSKDLILKGSLQGDDLARSLVPLLLKKADRLKRGHCQRTGCSEAPATGLLELGWALGGMLKNKEVQRAFGISRELAKEAFVPLVCPLLPQFFLAEGRQLVESASAAMSLLQKDGRRRHFLLTRDEVVYAKVFSLVHGLSD